MLHKPHLIGFGFFLLLIFSPTSGVHCATNSPFPGNNGQTGLWDMPNARVMPDWNARLNFSYQDPYRYWSGTVGLFDRFEFNGRVTDITTVPFAGQEFARDKAVDFKFLLLKERDWLPATALGFTDIHGTGLFSSRYLTFSKRIKYLDLTLGIGQGILAGEIHSGDAEDFHFSNPFDKETRVFGGLEFHITDDLSFVGEYSSYDYENLRGNTKADWPINFGFKYRFADYFLASVSYQKGEELSFGLGVTFPFDPELLVPWKKRPFYTTPEKVRLDALEAENAVLAYLVADQVSMLGLRNVRAAARHDAIWVEFVNNRYTSNQKAMGRVARIVDRTAPPRIDWLYLALVRDGIIIYTWKVHRSLFNAFLEWRLDDQAIWENSEHFSGGDRLWHDFMARANTLKLEKAPRGQRKFSVDISPRGAAVVNDPSGFFTGALFLDTSVDYQPWKGGLFRGTYRFSLINNLSSSVGTLEPCAVRSDFIDYLSDSNPRVTALAFDQIFEVPKDVLGRAAVGAFERMYMGVGGELFRYFGDGKFGVGLESEYVKKRDLDSQFKAVEGCPGFYTAFLNLYYHLWPSQGVDAGLKIGRFLAGDEGVRLDVRRTFKYFTLGAWYTVTDTSDFTSSFNKGYNDKGIYFSFPLSIFFDSDLAGRFAYVLRPWTRDTGAVVAQPRHLYPFMDEANPVRMKQHIPEIRR
jgi:hypothetical protein